MSTPRFYSWDDDGSPGRALSGNLQNRLKQILVPCLVTGYGSKPGAGWTVGHEHANGFSLINTDGNVVNFVSNLPAQAPYPAMNAEAIHIYLANSITDSSGPIIAGAGLCSGPYRYGLPELGGSPRHSISAKRQLQDNLSTLQWTVVADDKTVALVLSGGVAGSDANHLAYVNFSSTLYFGGVLNDLLLANDFVALGGSNSGYNVDPSRYTLSGGCTSVTSPLTGLHVYEDVQSEPFKSRLNTWPRLEAGSVMPAHIFLQSPRIAVGDSYIGRLRGVVYDDVLAIAGWKAYVRALGFSGTDYTDRGKVVSIGAHQYAYAVGYAGGFVMTTDPAFW